MNVDIVSKLGTDQIQMLEREKRNEHVKWDFPKKI